MGAHTTQPQDEEAQVAQSGTDHLPSRGYPKLARLMASSSEAAIFRQFRELQLIKLLKLQAELQDLENEYRKIRIEDMNSDDRDRINLVDDFRFMRKLAESQNSKSGQYDILERISQCLKEYNDALTQIFTIRRMPKPKKRDISGLRNWLSRPGMGENFLVGIEAEIWDEANEDDFINPISKDVDKLNSILKGLILNAYHWLYKHREPDSKSPDIGTNLRLHNDKKINQFANVLAALLSSLLPTLMVLVLYFVPDLVWRRIMTVAFTAIFAATLAVFTNAKKVEVYSATAAFAAVEFVFFSSSFSGP
ncbi:hypothetical protein F4677DRAFT_440937 [Hypoxylon crocopeplum]|nr:hypothetical protein F4677DRAFT_440937 [Hypoxylon crocopeplum]